MKMKIVSCPRCGTFLLQDTTECHSCGHVLQPAVAQAKTRMTLEMDGGDESRTCSNCGETCRGGLVRCWNCSAFLRPEIEESYRRMLQSGRQKREHVELPILEATSVTEEDSLRRRVSAPDSYLPDRPYATEDPFGGDDFELSSDAEFAERDDAAYELNVHSVFPKEMKDLMEQSGLETFRHQLETAQRSIPTETPVVANETPVAMPAEVSSEPAANGEPAEPPANSDTMEPPAAAESVEPPVSAAANEAPPLVEERQADELLKIAADEEQDIKRVRLSQRSKDTFVIYCPQGCRIRVKEKHRGMSGKCPRCQSEFVVPKKQVAKKGDNEAEQAQPVLASRYQKWLPEIRLHTVDPLKLRIKADSLLNECQSVDLGFAREELLVATLMAGKFGANVKKAPPIRQAMIEHFLKQGTFETLAVAAKKLYSKDLLSQFSVAQPAPIGTESLFADIPVFGVNRIAVKVPKTPDEPHAKYLSFCLSEFRAFVQGMQGVCGIENFGNNLSVPMSDDYATHKCHLTQAPVLELAKVNYYEKDPGFKLEISGWRCAACGIVISEKARADTKLGGANGKAIAKSKCPKCTLKFGSITLYQLAGAADPQPVPEPEAAMA